MIVDTGKWTDMSRPQQIGTPFLNLFDWCLTPASSLKVSTRSDVGRFLMKSINSSMQLYRARSERIMGLYTFQIDISVGVTVRLRLLA